MNSKRWYKDTFDSMEMSEEAMRKVKGIMEKKEKKRMRTGVRAAAAAALLAVVFLLGNAAVYAATGSTLVEKGMEQIQVFIDKKAVDVKEMKQYKDKDGHSVYEVKLEDKEGRDMECKASWDEETLKDEHMSAIMDVDETGGCMTLISGKLEKRGTKIYLIVDGAEKDLDITKDFADGDAKGSFKLAGEKYRYHVTGTAEKYDVAITKE